MNGLYCVEHMVTSRKHVSRLEAKENYVIDGKITITEEKRNEIKKTKDGNQER